MAVDITIRYHDEVYVRVDCNEGIAKELTDFFTFQVPGYMFNPKFKLKLWDGKIRLLNYRSNLIYSGLVWEIEKFARARKYSIDFEEPVIIKQPFSIEEAAAYAKSLNIHSAGKKIEPHDYQIITFAKAIRNRRHLVLSPTASGKSLIQYMIARYLTDMGLKGLMIVPTTALVEQMAGDFKDYSLANGWDTEANVHKIYASFSKDPKKPVTISTWQGIYRQPDEWFNQFDFILGDEAHQYKAQSIKKILEGASNARWRVGFTGTLDDMKTHELVIVGLFGPVLNLVTTKKLMDRGIVSNMRIKCIILKHPPEDAAALRKYIKEQASKNPQSGTHAYQYEIDYLVSNDARNRFIKNLALSLKGNSIILYQYVERHGQILYDILKEKDGRDIHFVHGKVEVEDREAIRHLLEGKQDSIVVASYGTFSTGTNIKNLHNIILASPSKSKIRNLQSIGRGLRKHDSKAMLTLYDIVDDLRHNDKENFGLAHFEQRAAVYAKEEFNYKLYYVDMERK